MSMRPRSLPLMPPSAVIAPTMPRRPHAVRVADGHPVARAEPARGAAGRARPTAVASERPPDRGSSRSGANEAVRTLLGAGSMPSSPAASASSVAASSLGGQVLLGQEVGDGLAVVRPATHRRAGLDGLAQHPASPCARPRRRRSAG